MIPVFQSRTSTEAIGNCFEACLASILEIPLTQIPDRGRYAPADWPAQVAEAREKGGDEAVGNLILDVGDWDDDLDRWLSNRGLARLELELSRRGLTASAWLELPASAGYWVGTHETDHDSAHAVVYHGGEVVHNPMRGILGDEGLGALIYVTAFIAADPRRIARSLGPEMLPDIADQVSRLLESVG